MYGNWKHIFLLLSFGGEGIDPLRLRVQQMRCIPTVYVQCSTSSEHKSVWLGILFWRSGFGLCMACILSLSVMCSAVRTIIIFENLLATHGDSGISKKDCANALNCIQNQYQEEEGTKIQFFFRC